MLSEPFNDFFCADKGKYLGGGGYGRREPTRTRRIHANLFFLGTNVFIRTESYDRNAELEREAAGHTIT